jgi:predicted PolB exonuclease-like 3'-5' exonuclease
MTKINRLIWDIETSPNIAFLWRAGYRLNVGHHNIISERAVICICYKWEGSKKVHHLEWDNGCDKKMLKEFLEVAKQADELVAHNGDRFDIKWFNTRCLFHGLEPIGDWKTVDTLVIAKRRFCFNSNALDYLGRFLFGSGKCDDGGFDTWKEIVLDNSKKAMRTMVKYCKRDVELLERVWKALEPYHKPKTHVGRLMGRDGWSCPYTGSEDVVKSKTRFTTAGTRQHQMYSKEAKAYYTISEKSYKDYQKWRKEKSA